MDAGSTLNTFGQMGLPRVFFDSPHGACPLTFQAFIAFLADPSLKKGQGGEQTEQCAQGAKIAAPEARNKVTQGKDPSEDQEGNGRHIEDRLKIMDVG